jgi:peptidoglycan/LPS O-acetylase OafA/YrhL
MRVPVVAGLGTSRPHTKLDLTRRRVIALDGLRAVAVLWVVMYHLGLRSGYDAPGVASGGYLGVDVFFVLSGFLITSLLIGEWDRRRGIHIGAFYARRALRLLPALFTMLAAVSIVQALDPHLWIPVSTVQAIPWVLGYAVNWGLIIHNNTPYWGTVLGHTWSLAVEEQFYIVWPPICWLILRIGGRRCLVAHGLLCVAALDAWWTLHLSHDGASYARLYFGSDTHSLGLIVGCSVAFWVSHIQRIGFRMKPPLSALVGWAGILGLAFTLTRASGQQVLWTPPASAFAALVIFGLVVRPVPLIESALSAKPVSWVGKRSYVLYLWHYPILMGFDRAVPTWSHRPFLNGAVILSASLAVTTVSFAVLERPLLTVSDRRRAGQFRTSRLRPAAWGTDGDSAATLAT